MNETLPKVQQTMPMVYKQAVDFLKSGLAPVHIKTPEQAMIIAAQGRELGLPFYASMRSFFVVGNQAHPNVQIKLALAMQSGELEDFSVATGQNEIIATVKRKGRKSPIVTRFGAKEATNMQLINKDNYKKQAMTMYQKRALGSALDMAFADILLGLKKLPDVENIENQLPLPIDLATETPDEPLSMPLESPPGHEKYEQIDVSPAEPVQEEAPVEPPEMPSEPSTEELVLDIRDKLGSMNGGEIDAMNAHLKKLTQNKDKTKYLTMESLVRIAPKFPDWIKTIHEKVVKEYNDEFKG